MLPLLMRIQHHLRETGTAPTRFGRDAVRDPRLVGDLVRGRRAGKKLAARIIAHIEGQS